MAVTERARKRTVKAEVREANVGGGVKCRVQMCRN